MNLHRITDHCFKVWKSQKKGHSDARAKYLVSGSVKIQLGELQRKKIINIMDYVWLPFQKMNALKKIRKSSIPILL
jgi:hypothetical protein